jgi:membrane-bound lytic murein transglycosylase MltF
MLFRRYLLNTQFVKGAGAEVARQRFLALVALFRKYGSQYNMDWMLMAAQGYQESRLDHNARSHVGAIGVMQVMPATGSELNVGDIKKLEPNIHAGVKLMRTYVDRYFAKEPMDEVNKVLFGFAAYNAGAGRVRQLRREAAARGLDQNVWLNNVERIASERRPRNGHLCQQHLQVLCDLSAHSEGIPEPSKPQTNQQHWELAQTFYRSAGLAV